MMVNVKVLEEVKKRLSEDIERAKDLLSSGGIVDWREYGYLTGGIKGLRDAIGVIDLVVDEFTKGE
jgi:hypothetical protein